MMKTIIISGGFINQAFLQTYMKENHVDYIIGVDKGIEMCYQCNIIPSILMGDFDSIRGEILDYYEKNTTIEIRRFKPEKDDTDTQMAIRWAIQLKSTQIVMIGSTGSRIDHLLGNIQSLCMLLENNIEGYIIDEYNKIMLLKEQMNINKSEQYGDYISLLALTNQVTGLTLTGFKYPLYEYTLTNQSGGFGVSNEILDENASIAFRSGILIMIQSKD